MTRPYQKRPLIASVTSTYKHDFKADILSAAYNTREIIRQVSETKDIGVPQHTACFSELDLLPCQLLKASGLIEDRLRLRVIRTTDLPLIMRHTAKSSVSAGVTSQPAVTPTTMQKKFRPNPKK